MTASVLTDSKCFNAHGHFPETTVARQAYAIYAMTYGKAKANIF